MSLEGALYVEPETVQGEALQRRIKAKRIAVILPVAYRDAVLREAKLLAQALFQGSRQFNEPVEVVFLHLDDEQTYPEAAFADLYPGIKRRAFNWKILPPDAARCAMRCGGHQGWEPQAADYQVVDDGIRQLQDCDSGATTATAVEVSISAIVCR